MTNKDYEKFLKEAMNPNGVVKSSKGETSKVASYMQPGRSAEVYENSYESSALNYPANNDASSVKNIKTHEPFSDVAKYLESFYNAGKGGEYMTEGGSGLPTEPEMDGTAASKPYNMNPGKYSGLEGKEMPEEEECGNPMMAGMDMSDENEEGINIAAEMNDEFKMGSNFKSTANAEGFDLAEESAIKSLLNEIDYCLENEIEEKKKAAKSMEYDVDESKMPEIPAFPEPKKDEEYSDEDSEDEDMRDDETYSGDDEEDSEDEESDEYEADDDEEESEEYGSDEDEEEKPKKRKKHHEEEEDDEMKESFLFDESATIEESVDMILQEIAQLEAENSEDAEDSGEKKSDEEESEEYSGHEDAEGDEKGDHSEPDGDEDEEGNEPGEGEEKSEEDSETYDSEEEEGENPDNPPPDRDKMIEKAADEGEEDEENPKKEFYNLF